MKEPKPNGGSAPIAEQILDQFKPGAWLKKAEIASALGVEAHALTGHLGKLIAEKDLIATGSTSTRAFALPGTDAPSGTAVKAKAPKKPTAAKRVKKMLKDLAPAATAPKTPASETPPIFIDQAISHLLWKRDAIDKAITALKSL